MNFKDELLLNSINEYLKTGNINILTVEESTTTITDDIGKSMRVLVDPSPEAVISMLEKMGPKKHLGGIKLNDEFCFWDRDDSSHNNVARQLGYGNDFVGFYLNPLFGKKDGKSTLMSTSVDVTDFSGIGRYNFDGAIEELSNSDFLMSINSILDYVNTESDTEDDISDLLNSLSPNDY